MKAINIGDTLIKKRKERGITQDELASFIGVSKASVSKWETGHSYPDVLFLPQLAAYFNISLDELMSYEPQMTDNDIRKLYVELIKEFTSKPFTDVADRCRELIKKYYSCFPLIFQVATLMCNYSLTLKDSIEKNTIISETKLIFKRVKELSNNIELRKMALQAEASCEMLLNNPNNIVFLLENESRTVMQPSLGVLLSQAQEMKGNLYEAKIVLQESIFDDIIILFHDLSAYLSICKDNLTLFEETCKRVTALNDIFKIDTLHPLSVLSFYMSAAEGYIAFEDKEKTLKMLEAYSAIATSGIFPLGIKADNFFTLINEIREQQLKENALIMPQLPLDEQSIISAVIDNPVFSSLSTEVRYKILTEKLKSL